MWGILSIGLLLFVLYHYRPKRFYRASEFRDALLWSEWGKRFAIGHAIVILGLIYGSEVLWVLKESHVNTVLDVLHILFRGPTLTDARTPSVRTITFFACSIFLPLFFTWMIHENLVKPLSMNKIPSRKRSRLVFGTGLLFLILLTTPIIVTILRFGAVAVQSFLQASFIIVPIFYGMFIASVFSIGVAAHELRKLTTQYGYIINQTPT